MMMMLMCHYAAIVAASCYADTVIAADATPLCLFFFAVATITPIATFVSLRMLTIRRHCYCCFATIFASAAVTMMLPRLILPPAAATRYTPPLFRCLLPRHCRALTPQRHYADDYAPLILSQMRFRDAAITLPPRYATLTI